MEQSDQVPYCLLQSLQKYDNFSCESVKEWLNGEHKVLYTSIIPSCEKLHLTFQ